MSGDDEQSQRDVAALRGAVRLLDERNSANLHIPSPSAEFVLFETARLLEAIAASVERGKPVADDVLETAERFARHIHHYIDTYLPSQT
ncbi:MAG: hypothetical protein QOI50_5928 [Pseudonocardiales bacterium]|jgi:hypothetical protein|nr:hypothetical protein [Pseudonocardiales bacterium]